jgi:hypothetical protein
MKLKFSGTIKIDHKQVKAILLRDIRNQANIYKFNKENFFKQNLLKNCEHLKSLIKAGY